MRVRATEHEMMCGRGGTLLVLLAFLSLPFAVDAQQGQRVYRIGVLETVSPALNAANFEAFRHGLHALGYVEGQNLVIEYRSADGDASRFPAFATELVRLHVDIILTGFSTPAALAAKQATSMIPIVMAGVGGDPVETGLVTSLARPEGNVTGVTASGSDLWEQRLALLREAVPRLSRLAFLWNPANPGNALCLRELKAVAPAMGVQVHLLEIRDANAFERAFAAIVQEPPDALSICWDAVTSAHAKRIADFAVWSRLPTMTPMRTYVQAGALMSLGASRPVLYRRAADYVDKILKGTKPADLPVERPMQFELVINLQTAQALGLTLPPRLLFQANEVIR
jgi:putative ABC transport system substrate-binding protein